MSVKPDGYHTQCRPEMMKYIPENARTILDVGCGEGLFGYQLKQRMNSEIWGIEIDEKAGNVAKTKIDKVFVGDLSGIIDTLPDNYFDCIVFNDVLEHLADPFSTLVNIKSKIREGGVIVSSIPNIRYFFTLWNLVINKQWRYEDAGILDKTHLRFFTRKSIIEMFGTLGYEIVKIEGVNQIKSWKVKLINRLSFGFLSDTMFTQYACIVKPR